MQKVSEEYIKSMSSPFRNRAYMQASIGIINSDAQHNATIGKDYKNYTYYSDFKKPFENNKPNRIYATAEENFSKIDGTMYFLPKNNSDFSFYNNGLVTEELLGSITIYFEAIGVLDIKGLTIDFGDSYPTKIMIQSDNVDKEYVVEESVFVTDDVFDETSYIRITPLEMLNGECRFRIHKINFGTVDSFDNNQLISCSINEFVSATSESLPSKDIEIIVDNQDSYYNPDNLESAIGYLELGQEVKLVFGYDVGDGKIEWLPEILTYLKSWNANDTQAQFICTDLFDSMTGVYYKGKYREEGISLYDLALDILDDAGIDTSKCFIDKYLKNIIIQNPMPQVKHSEALQIIANAGRCAIFEDRKGRIRIQASFKPYLEINSNGEYDYSRIANVLNYSNKVSYAVASKDFTKLDDENMLFRPVYPKDVLNCGYISDSIADSDGLFNENPKLTITSEASFMAFGFEIEFRNTKPEEFVLRTFNDDVEVESIVVQPKALIYRSDKQFEHFDRMEIEFTKGYPNGRVFIDNIQVIDGTNYHINRNLVTGSPVSTRKEKLKSLSVIRNIYKKSDKIEELSSDEIELSEKESDYIVYFQEACYELKASVLDDTSVKVSIVESGSYYAKLRFEGIKSYSKIKVQITGKKYLIENYKYTIEHNKNGECIEWNNPLISSVGASIDLADWLSSYYLGRVEYEIDWRGDPRVDANDLFYFELKDGTERLIRSYENSISFNGSFSGKIKARAVNM